MMRGQLGAHRLSIINQVILQKVRTRQGSRVGVSCLQFDRSGTYLAAGGSNGLIRFFNFASCAYNIPRICHNHNHNHSSNNNNNHSNNSNHHESQPSLSHHSHPSIPPPKPTYISPCALLHTERDVAAVSWSYAHPLHIAVAFRYSSEIAMYDLSGVILSPGETSSTHTGEG